MSGVERLRTSVQDGRLSVQEVDQSTRETEQELLAASSYAELTARLDTAMDAFAPYSSGRAGVALEDQDAWHPLSGRYYSHLADHARAAFVRLFERRVEAAASHRDVERELEGAVGIAHSHTVLHETIAGTVLTARRAVGEPLKGLRAVATERRAAIERAAWSDRLDREDRPRVLRSTGPSAAQSLAALTRDGVLSRAEGEDLGHDFERELWGVTGLEALSARLSTVVGLLTDGTRQQKYVFDPRDRGVPLEHDLPARLAEATMQEFHARFAAGLARLDSPAEVDAYLARATAIAVANPGLGAPLIKGTVLRRMNPIEKPIDGLERLAENRKRRLE
jgi:hypothetical protein